MYVVIWGVEVVWCVQQWGYQLLQEWREALQSCIPGWPELWQVHDGCCKCTEVVVRWCTAGARCSVVGSARRVLREVHGVVLWEVHGRCCWCTAVVTGKCTEGVVRSARQVLREVHGGCHEKCTAGVAAKCRAPATASVLLVVP